MAGLYQVLVISTSAAPGTNVRLFYLTKEAAEVQHVNIQRMQQGKAPTDTLVASDDFGHILTIEREKICYSLFIDADKQLELQAMHGAPGTISTALQRN